MKVKHIVFAAIVVVVLCFFLDLLKSKMFLRLATDTGMSVGIKCSYIKSYIMGKSNKILEIENKLLSKETNIDEKMRLMDEYFCLISGAENIKEDSRGEFVNAKHLHIIEKQQNKKFYSTWEAENGTRDPSLPNLVAGQMLESMYHSFKMIFLGEFVAYDYIKDLNPLVVSAKGLKEKLDKEQDKDKIFYLLLWAKATGRDKKQDYFDHIYNHFTKDDRDLKWKIDSIGKIPFELAHESVQGDEAFIAANGNRLDGFHLRRGKDVIFGCDLNDNFIGGSGDDILDGGDGDDEIDGFLNDDIIYGGRGNDVLRGGEGNDLYVFNLNDGHDIIDDENGEDTLYFGEGITKDMLVLKDDSKDLIIEIKGKSDSVRIIDNKVERIQIWNDGIYTPLELFF